MVNKEASSRGGLARASRLTAGERREAAVKAARARWGERKTDRDWVRVVADLAEEMDGEPGWDYHQKPIERLLVWLKARE